MFLSYILERHELSKVRDDSFLPVVDGWELEERVKMICE